MSRGRPKKEFFKDFDYILEEKDKGDLDHYLVYYLPEEHYVGYTKNIVKRISDHRYNKKNCKGFVILWCGKDKKDAIYHEGLFQATLGFEGMRG